MKTTMLTFKKKWMWLMAGLTLQEEKLSELQDIALETLQN